MKTSELTGAALDWAVAKCEGVSTRGFTQFYGYVEGADEDCPVGVPMYAYQSEWSLMGPIIEREHIGLLPSGNAYYERNGGTYFSYGETPLIAAARCYVVSKLGDTVDAPEELC